MTLIIAAVTHDFAVLASDRRIQYTVRNPGSDPIVLSQEDTDTKSAIVDGRYVLGFAGMGRIIRPGASHQGWRLEVWMTTELGRGAAEGDFFEFLAEKFGRLCEEVGFNRLHTFVAAGFASDNEPTLVTVRNSRRFPHTFDVKRQTLANDEPYLLQPAGEALTKVQSNRIESALKWITKWQPDQPYPLHKRLTEVVRNAASNSEGRVGETVLVTSFPRRAVPLPDGTRIIIGEIGREAYRTQEVSKTYSADGSDREFHPARFSPVINMGSAVVASLPEGEWIGPQPGDIDPDG